MNRISEILTKRIQAVVRKERASENKKISLNTPTWKRSAPYKELHVTRTAHCMYPIAVRLDIWFPQSEMEDGLDAETSRKARQIRRKSKTHTRN